MQNLHQKSVLVIVVWCLNLLPFSESFSFPAFPPRSLSLTSSKKYGVRQLARHNHDVKMVIEKSSSVEPDESILDPATESLLKQIPPEAGEVINKKIELMMDGKKEDPVSAEEFEALMETVPEEVRDSLRMVGIGAGRRGPMTEAELLGKLPSELRPMVAELSTAKKETLLNMNVDIAKQLRKKGEAGVKFNTDEEIRKMVQQIYDSVFEVDTDSITSAEDVKKSLTEEYTSALDNVQILNERMKKEAKNYKESLQEYQALQKELKEEMERDPMYQLRLFGEKSFPQKASLVLAIMISNDTVFQIIKFVDGRDGNILLAATQILGIIGLLYFYGLFGGLSFAGEEKRMDSY